MRVAGAALQPPARGRFEFPHHQFGEVGEDFAVEGDTGGLETLHKSGVAQTERAGDGVDALNPEVAEAALLGLAVTSCVGFGFTDGVLRIAEMRGTEAAVTFGFCQHALTALPAGGGVGGSWHVFSIG